MNKSETKKLTNLIKGYYNSEFFMMIMYYKLGLILWNLTTEDAEEHIKEYLKEKKP